MFQWFLFINNDNVTEFEDVNFILPFVLCCLLTIEPKMVFVFVYSFIIPFGLSAPPFYILFT